MSPKLSSAKFLKIILATGILCLFIFLNHFGFLLSARKIFLEITYPFQKIFYITSEKISEIFEICISISEIKNENKNLVKENNSLTAQNSLLADQKRENEILRKQLDLAPRQQYNLQAALIIGRDPSGSSSWLMIDKGESSGIKTGMPVIVSDGILVGKIGEIYRNESQVILLANSSSSINAMDVETGAKGIINGEYGLGLVMNMVEQTAVLKEGDTIVTSGLGEIEPKGLLIGKLQQVESSNSNLFQQAVVVPD